jgi:ectoine hydroxylase
VQLSEAQIAEFDERGVLLFPELLNSDEVSLLQRDVTDLMARQGPEVVREQEPSSAIRLVFGGHQFSKAFGLLTRLPRILNPVRQLLRDDVYLHQSRLNPKEGFGTSGSWDFHQDYGPWFRLDGMLEPRCVMTAVFVDDCTETTSPLSVVPGTQNQGYIDAVDPDSDASGAAVYNLDHDILKQLVVENGVEELIALAGSVCFIHCNLIHGSAANVSPSRRAIMYLNYNAASNACTRTERDWYHNNRDFTPLEPIDDDSLAALGEDVAD